MSGLESIRLPPQASRRHRAWHSRGYIPHLDEPGLVQFVTFRLVDSVPSEVVLRWKDELGIRSDTSADDPRCASLRRRIDRWADEGHGACWLRDPRIAEQIEATLLHFDSRRYHLIAWVVMPNHVHVLIETLPGFPLDVVVHSWKSFSAQRANRLLGRSGAFWMPDYVDRFIRNEGHLRATTEYIEGNPVKAGLAVSPGDWLWGSAARRRNTALR